MIYTFGKKFTDLQIDAFVNEFYLEFKKDPSQKFFFDLSKTEWVSNQELIVFTGILKYLRVNNLNFYVKLFEPGLLDIIEENSIRSAKNIIELWEIWKVYQVLEIGESKKYFGIDDNFVRLLKNRIKYKPNKSFEIFQRYGVTPFISLNFLKNYNDRIIEDLVDKELNDYSKLNSALSEILLKIKCFHPFINKTLSLIVAKEFYENFLDHADTSFFGSKELFSFMSSTVIPKWIETKTNKDEIQQKISLNFNTEHLPETKNFYFNGQFKNNSYVQFTFCDFGDGIPNSLNKSFENYYGKSAKDDDEILEYAFSHFGSKQPIYEKLDKMETPIPRGLFDALTIVKRYLGLIIIRSNYGKILYDFSESKDIINSKISFGNKKMFFPGTLISIYLPALDFEEQFEYSAIKPEKKPLIDFLRKRKRDKVYVNLFSFYEKFKDVNKGDDLYIKILEYLKAIFSDDNSGKLVFFSFIGWQLDKRLTRKILFYLISDYDINISNNIIITYPPDDEYLETIKFEIFSLNEIIKKYKIHPLPLAYFNREDNSWDIKWLGIFDKNDEEKLKQILLEDILFSRKDFQESYNLDGHIFTYDKNGNLISFLPSEEMLNEYLKGDNLDYSNDQDEIGFEEFEDQLNEKDEQLFKEYLEKENNAENKIDEILNNLVAESNSNEIYFTGGNYYQKEFIDLTRLFFDNDNLEIIIDNLCVQLYNRIDAVKEKYLFIGLNSNSHKINNKIKDNRIFNSNSFLNLKFNENEENIIKKINYFDEQNIIIVCDVFATGNKIDFYEKVVGKCGKKLINILVVVSTIVDETKYFEKLISLKNMPIVKYNYEEIKLKLKEKEIIRINPFTNIPIKFSIQDTLYSQSVIFENSEQFLDCINEEDIDIGLLNFNEILHLFYFNTEKILSNKNEILIKKIFDIQEVKSEKLNIFFPKDSDIKKLEEREEWFNGILFGKTGVAKFYELERIGTKDGWKFPHADLLETDIKGKTAILLDDGSCTGNSLFQMVDEIAFFNPQNIVLICIIGRLKDFHREFLSRQKFIRSRDLNSDSEQIIPLNVYFGSIWNIPTYPLQNNAFQKEINWINNLVSYNNCPQGIKRIGSEIKLNLLPKNKDNFSNYKYFPTGCDDKKKLISTRNEIGKVIGYRFYKESFIYFDNIIKSNPLDINKLNTVELEYICANIMYENVLFDNLCQALPDFKQLLRLFIFKIIFTKEIPQKTLKIKFSKKDTIFLLFLFNEIETIIEYLKNENTRSDLFSFFNFKKSNCNYFFYRLLRSVAFEIEDKTNGESTRIFTFVETLIENDLIPIPFISSFKIFQSFISSLPSESNFDIDLNNLGVLYRNIIDQEKHNFSILAKYDDVTNIVDNLSYEFNEIDKDLMLNEWKDVSNFITSLLSFSANYPSFFIAEYQRLEGESENSLRNIHGFLNEKLNELDDKSDYEKILRILSNLKSLFLTSSSPIFKIFSKKTTKVSTLDIINRLGGESVIENNNYILKIPELFFNIVFSEIKNNLRYKAKETQVIIDICVDGEYLVIVISNDVVVQDFEDSKDLKEYGETSGGNGQEILNNLNFFPQQNIIYIIDDKYRESKYSQELKIKIAD